MKTLKIKVSKWLHGKTKKLLGGSQLFRQADGKMCCLGFYCLMLGVPRQIMLRRLSPSDIPNAYKDLLPNWLVHPAGGLTPDGDTLMEINDAVGHKSRCREIKKIFARHDVKVEFVE